MKAFLNAFKLGSRGSKWRSARREEIPQPGPLPDWPPTPLSFSTISISPGLSSRELSPIEQPPPLGFAESSTATVIVDVHKKVAFISPSTTPTAEPLADIATRIPRRQASPSSSDSDEWLWHWIPQSPLPLRQGLPLDENPRTGERTPYMAPPTPELAIIGLPETITAPVFEDGTSIVPNCLRRSCMEY